MKCRARGSPSGFGGGKKSELVLDRKFGLQRAAVAFGAASNCGR
jgi:hypothetical protein